MSLKIKSSKEVQGSITAVTGQPERWRWYHGVAFYFATQAIAFGLSGLVSAGTGKKGKNASETFFGDVSYFRTLKQSKVTPPSKAFAPAWTLNNILSIYGNLRVLNMPAGTPGRNTYLVLQAATWLDYMVFNAAYFSLKSPLNAVVLTLGMFGLTIASILVSIFKLKDTKVALSLVTLFLWLTVASTAAITQALWNHDELYQAGPFAEPDPAWVRESIS